MAPQSGRAQCWSAVVAGVMLASASPVFAQHSPSLEARIADYVAIFALVFVPLVLIAVFWMVHILPEKIAERRGHPQAAAIKTLCLLSLVFGGLLWPLAWLWAYSRPVLHKMAYGTDRIDHHGDEETSSDAHVSPPAVSHEVARLEEQVAAMHGGAPTPEAVRKMRAALDALEEKLATAGERPKEL